MEESPSKRTAGVAFIVNEQTEVVGGMCPSDKRKKSSGRKRSRVAASTSGMVTEIGLPEMVAKVGQRTSGGSVGVPMFCDATLGFELPPREERSAARNFPIGVNISQVSLLRPY